MRLDLKTLSSTLPPHFIPPAAGPNSQNSSVSKQKELSLIPPPGVYKGHYGTFWRLYAKWWASTFWGEPLVIDLACLEPSQQAIKNG